MITPDGPVCDHCRKPVTITFSGFFSPEIRACSPECLSAIEAARRQAALSTIFEIQRGWIDCAGKCRTWKVKDGNGSHIAEVTRLRDAQYLILLLAGNYRTASSKTALLSCINE